MNAVWVLISVINSLCALNIVNVTSPINLTTTFMRSNGVSLIEILRPGTMTYYIDPKDNSNTQFLWLGISDTFDTSKPDVFTDVKSDIFTTKWNQYTKLNTLPFTLTEILSISNDSVWQTYLGPNIMCTSPISHDIFTCWTNFTFNVSDESGIQNTLNIQCNIYWVKQNEWSPTINITSSYMLNLATNVLCFDDSYFIPRLQIDLHSHNPVNIEHCYATLLDLHGNIIHDKIDLRCPKYPSAVIYQYLFTIKGDDSYNVINTKATSTFMINIAANDLEQDVSFFQGNYGYYTNINDSNPIVIYNISQINRNTLSTDWDIDIKQGNTVKIKNDCCYVSLYGNQTNPDNSDWVNIYAMITDMYGNSINMTNNSNNFDILLVQNVTEIITITPQIIDLSSVYNGYFLIIYGIGTDAYEASQIMCDAYYLQYITNDNVYSIENVGSFEVFELIYYGEWQSFSMISSHILSDSDSINLFVSWSQHGWDGNDVGIWGQTFQIN